MNWRNPFKKRFRSRLLDNKYKVVEAFQLGGTTYYMFDQTAEVPTGRMLAALAVYTEMEMKVDKEYLDLHTRAMEKLLSDPKKINVMYIAQLNLNLKERLELMPLPDFVYKLASVIFFDETESPYSYSFEYNKKKIEAWKKSGDTLDFFFEQAVQRIDTILKTCYRKYKHVFSSSRTSRRNTPNRSYKNIVGKSVDDHTEQIQWLADFNPSLIDAYNRMPLPEYYSILDTKIASLKKQIKDSGRNAAGNH